MPVQTTPVIAQQARQGTFTSGSFSIPANILLLQIVANIALADKLATGLTCDLNLERSADGGTSWFPLVGFGWTSYGPAGYHTVDKTGQAIDNPDPSLTFNPRTFDGQLFRLVSVIPQTLTVGATVVVTT